MDRLWNTETPLIKFIDNAQRGITKIWHPSGTQRVHISDISISANFPSSGWVQLNTNNTLLSKYYINSGSAIIDNLQTPLEGDSAQPLTAVVSGSGSYFIRVTGFEY